MLPVKLPYYSQINAQQHVTRFGVAEVDQAQIYDRPLSNNKIIVRVDALSCLQELLGSEPFICRDLIYSVLAGESPKYDPVRVFASFYRKYSGITSYVNDKYYYGDDSIPIFDRSVLPLREMVDSYKESVKELLLGRGGKYLIESKDFVYFAFNVCPDLSDIKGVTVIC